LPRGDDAIRCGTAHGDILAVAGALKAASGLTEGTFLEIGRLLGSSVEILERLTALFSRLQVELESPEMRDTTAGLSQVAGQVSVLAGARHDERVELERLSRITRGLQRRIDEIFREVRTIDVLIINAKITASSIGPAGTEFLLYIGEIGESLKVTEANLQNFRDDLKQVSSHLGVVGAGEAEFDTRHAATVAVIPRQLSESVDLITARRQTAAAAAADVSLRSRHVGAGIARVVMALQIGDASRQRMEHAQEAAELMAQMLSAGDDPSEPWAALSGTERQALAALGCALQAAQMVDAADEFSREVASVHAALGELSADAREIVRLGHAIYGSTGHTGGPFLRELEDNVLKAHTLLEGFHAARVGADRAMASVLEIAARLAEHIGTVRTVEADIRIMSVNATLKSSRLGGAGRVLGVVAEELTGSSGRTATEANAATADVERIVAAAGSLAGQEQARRLAEIARVTALMTNSVNRLRGVAAGLTSALDALAQDGVAVVKALDDTTAGLVDVKEIDAAMRQAAARLTALASAVEHRPVEMTGAAGRMFELIAARYTMAREREIHARIAPGSAPPVAPAANAEAALEDVLF
jgi:hypothetical protein